MTQTAFIRCLGGAFLFLFGSTLDTWATDTLYVLNVNGTGNLLTVDAMTGRTTAIAPSLSLGAGSWNGLAASPGEEGILYALNNPRPATLDDPQFSRLVRIDAETADPTLLPVFDFEQLGEPDLFSSGLAISHLDPNFGVVVGANAEIPPKAFIWKVNLTDGSVAEPGRQLADVSRIESLTFAPDGQQLFGTNQSGELVNVDYETGDVSVVGSPGLSSFLTGVSFDPSNDSVLYAVEGGTRDRLLTLDPTTGESLGIIGGLGIRGPDGIAFVSSAGDPLDCNGDGSVDVGDLDCSNAVDITDALLTELGLFPGDLDGMNGVSFADFLVISQNFGLALNRYSEGDVNDNGTIDFGDFLAISNNFGATLGRAASTHAVPEPHGLMLPILLVFICNTRWMIRIGVVGQ